MIPGRLTAFNLMAPMSMSATALSALTSSILVMPPEAMTGIWIACAIFTVASTLTLGHHAVTADIGIDDRGDPVVFETLRHVDDIMFRFLGPASTATMPFFGIEADNHMARTRSRARVTNSGHSPPWCR